MKVDQSFIDKVQLVSFNSILTGGGISTYLEILYKYLGIQGEILTFAVRSSDKENSEIMNYEYCLCAKTVFSEIYFIPPSSLRNLVEIIRKKKIFHFNPHTFTEIFFMFLTKVFGKKNVVTYHSNLSGRNKWSFEFFRQVVVCNCLSILSDNVVFITEDQFENVKKKVLWKKKLISKKVLINNFIEGKNILKSKKFQKDLKVIFVGRLTKEKGYYDLLKVIEDKNFSNVQFTIVGKRSSDKEIINKKNVKYYNRIPNEKIFKIYDENSVFILPSYTEVFPLTILEAMARGLVVLTSDLLTIREYFKDERNGYFFSPGDTKRIKELILFLKNNPEENKRISKNNLIDIYNFTAEQQVLKYKDLYKGLI